MWLDDNCKRKQTVRFRIDNFSPVPSNKMIRRTDRQTGRQTKNPEVCFPTQCAISLRRTSSDKKAVRDKPIWGF